MARSPSPIETATRALAELADPVRFARDVFGDQLYDRQEEILRSVRFNRRTSVVGNNSAGKDYATARLVPWWLTIMRPSKVVIIGPTHRQVTGIVWSEVRKAVASASARGRVLAGRVLETAEWKIGPEWFAIGFATTDSFNITGFHSPHLMVIITEAHNVPSAHFESVERLNYERLVLTGNPFVTEGPFHASHHGERRLWSTVAISALDSPNVKTGRLIVPGLVTAEDVRERRERWGEDSPLYRSGVLGEWATELDDTLISLTWASAAAARRLCPRCAAVDPSEGHDAACKLPPPHPVLGVDVARYGGDKTVAVRRDGPRAQIVWRVQGHDTQEVAGWIGRYCRENPARGAVVVDEVGVGGGVVDALKHARRADPEHLRGWTVVPFSGGETARERDRYFNRNAEAWYLMREAFREGRISIPGDQALVGQLVSRKYTIQADARVKLESKEDYRKDGRPSPDEADALAMTFSPFYKPGSLETALRFI